MSACISRSEPLPQTRPRLEETPLALRLVELTQDGLPLLEDPWAWLAEQLGLSVESTLDLLKRLQAEGAIRRIAAVPNHYRLGYRHNGMTVWDVCDADVPRLGALLGAQPFVSHCYRRPRRAGWRYNLFAMVHGRSREEIDSYREHLRYLLGDACSADDMLVSSRILKKTGLRLSPVGAKLARETAASVSEELHRLHRGQALLPPRRSDLC
ncbi:Lrp/AsnC family transcriptional regulator [Pseudomonas fluorescens]|uniref:siroheme decarboxylase n=1 Tax=Pseudomonas fluorescens TaxID=294 RepID=A0A944HG90_PSEFL|nr:Lrp/AsnC family transcriptional regulator [Pseudomonas fluorescens]MBT2295813.1 Lrp/AsnC family transcriptional regulator [Pseudomonas fluorescens]MBT2306070.1 Lrp/AsnC family transcriptional regulator [Pseudomonas fluorescens]MBT2314573.1 Lrp/AsnC family transcriptional regulator [Pseudomonas fluorescens]MBT2315678.1 Lrp/AsnC family transcriptional regulator [Pseudomonas fluorescens]MBT2327118.1 Lrp/AsnC family transcriptional regulator [Pseudomonas fluorescens]